MIWNGQFLFGNHWSFKLVFGWLVGKNEQFVKTGF